MPRNGTGAGYRRAVREGRTIFLGYNLPFLLWTGYAVLLAVTGWNPHSGCPVRSLFGTCPACGLTAAYVRFLRGQPVADPRFGPVLSAFLLNAAGSLWRIRFQGRVNRRESAGSVLEVAHSGEDHGDAVAVAGGD